MKILPLSDLHLEFHRDGGESFIRSLPIDGNIVVISGDMATIKCLEYPIELLCSRAKEVIYVFGNHEYYGSSKKELRKLLAFLMDKFRNLHHLENSAVTIDGQRFLGTTMWFPFNSQYLMSLANRMNDFFKIKDNMWIFADEWNRSAVNFLNKEISPEDIVVTHHVPHELSLNPGHNHGGGELAPFYLCKMLDKNSTAPKLWLHGHTHYSCDYIIGNVRVVSNPFGYARYEENPSFNPNLIVEV